MIVVEQEFASFGIRVRHDVLTVNPPKHKIIFMEKASPYREKSITFENSEWKDEEQTKKRLLELSDKCIGEWGL